MAIKKLALLSTALALLCTGARAQEVPADCNGVLFTRLTGYISMSLLCKELVPDSAASFDRVISRYDIDFKSCSDAVRSTPQVANLLGSADAKSFMDKYRNGTLPASGISQFQTDCRSIEELDSDLRRWESTVKQAVPELRDPNGGG